ncbi:hypothetical protein [Fibrobacter sp. UBA4309]|jgi:hypothetical protein|uniref:hypothetical protein n=1 Tax=Fibrobacter sp. UBA4309 TaxID=1946537 RepID=UPI0025C523A0|nr:hypothetical protein [Fibrobacter sp. UBA4309]
MMTTVLFSIAVLALLLRIFHLRIKANNAKTASFQKLLPKDKLAVLKECLLNNPAECNLLNIKEFCESENIAFDAEGYRPFIGRQLELAKRMANYVECDKLYVEECEFIDKTLPLEFAEAEKKRSEGDDNAANKLVLEGVSRLYSDKAIDSALAALEPHYPKASSLREKYAELAKACDASGADEKSLEILRKQKEAWLADLLAFDASQPE